MMRYRLVTVAQDAKLLMWDFMPANIRFQIGFSLVLMVLLTTQHRAHNVVCGCIARPHIDTQAHQAQEQEGCTALKCATIIIESCSQLTV